MRPTPPNFEAPPVRKLTAKYTQGIGSVAVAHAYLELVITQLVSDVLRIDYGMGRLANRDNINTETMFKTVIDLIEMWDFKTTIDLDDALNAVKQCAVERNKLVHGTWLPDGDEFRVRLIKGSRNTPVGKLGRKWLPDWGQLEQNHFENVLALIEVTTVSLLALKSEVEVALRPWPRIDPGKPPPPGPLPHNG